MVEIKIVPETACLMFKLNGELINCKFYNKLSFEQSEYLKTHINNMLEYYRLHDCFTSEDLDLLMELADFTDFEISKLINKFHYINTRIADNGGAPVLKQILQLL